MLGTIVQTCYNTPVKLYADVADYVLCVDAPRVSNRYADVAELVDALASGASARKGVEVQVLLSAPIYCKYYKTVV